MNYAGFDIYAHNKATARFGRHVGARSLVPSTVALDCPFCGKAITANGGTLAEHSERFWTGRCPVSGYTVEEARRMAMTLTADYRLPCEGGMDD